LRRVVRDQQRRRTDSLPDEVLSVLLKDPNGQVVHHDPALRIAEEHAGRETTAGPGRDLQERPLDVAEPARQLQIPWRRILLAALAPPVPVASDPVPGPQFVEVLGVPVQVWRDKRRDALLDVPDDVWAGAQQTVVQVIIAEPPLEPEGLVRQQRAAEQLQIAFARAAPPGVRFRMRPRSFVAVLAPYPRSHPAR